ncbi:MAG: radical SAM protein [Kiritimatiellia bacterium]|nr:radical SAM protein [Kiritimatiellia bacterium]
MSNVKHFKYLFGPVPSRRFGRSLGVDLVPPKTCPLNCVFCEVGPTTGLTMERKEYVPIPEVERELKDWRAGPASPKRSEASGGTADVVSVTGSGEPTLHTGFGNILAFIKKTIKIKSVLLTNSTLLYLPDVRRSAALADIVKVTLSAWDDDSFRKIARPHPDLRFASLLEGLQMFRQEYSGTIWLEVFIVPGINSDLEQVKAIAKLARTIRPDKIQLNTAVRPTAESRVGVVPKSFLNEISGLFEPKAEVIAKFAQKGSGRTSIDHGSVLAMLNRRPCTAQDVAASFSLDIKITQAILREMVAQEFVRIEKRNGDDYYIGRE